MKDKYLRVGYICHSVFNVPRRKHTHTQKAASCVATFRLKRSPEEGSEGRGEVVRTYRREGTTV